MHELSLLVAKREGLKKQISIAQIKEVLRILRDIMSNKRNKKVGDIVEFLLTPKKK